MTNATRGSGSGMMGGMGFMGGQEAEARPVESFELAADTAVNVDPRLLIYTADLTISTANARQSIEAALKIAEQAGGFMQVMTNDTITLRVPAKVFKTVIEQLSGLGQVLDRQIEAEDVTEEVADLQLRLKNAQALRDRLLEILGKAAAVKDLLEVEKELTRVRLEIEQLEAQITGLQRRIAYSTIEVRFEAAAAPATIRHRPELPFPWVEELGVESVLRIEK